ncbi:MAG: carbon-phosphorus lyase complex subunit PhnI [Pseudomonadota bacterium]
MYVAVKGGEKAIDNAHKLLAEKRRGDPSIPEITTDQISEQMALAVDRVMTEGSLYDRTLAALAIKQARGDMIEAIFLVRASRTTLPRFGYSLPLDTGAMEISRRVSATYKDLPGGQILGPTFDYTHRLLDAELENQADVEPAERAIPSDEKTPHVLDLLSEEGLMEPPSSDPSDKEPDDLTRDPLSFPAGRDVRLQNLARGDEGFLLALGYSTQRGFARNHPFAGEIRVGTVAVEFVPEELGFPIDIGEIEITECEMVNQFRGSKKAPPQFTRGYGLTFGHCERKAMSMAQVDRALRADELGEDRVAPAQDEEFVLSHCDNVQATGFVEHLKLPHYVDFQSELELVRRMRKEQGADQKEAAE